MRKRAIHGLLLVLTAAAFTAGPLCARAGDILDRIVATVNGHAILQSDWEDELRYEAFMSGEASRPLTWDEQKAALDRLIDQELLGEQLRLTQTPVPSEQDLTRRLEDVRKLYAGADKDDGWQALLKNSDVTENGLRSRLALQMRLTRLVDVRLRPAISIDTKSIESYYNQELLPQLRKSGAKDVALEEVTPKIKEVLTEKKLNQLLVAWLQSLRASSSIRSEAVDDPAFLEPK